MADQHDPEIARRWNEAVSDMLRESSVLRNGIRCYGMPIICEFRHDRPEDDSCAHAGECIFAPTKKGQSNG